MVIHLLNFERLLDLFTLIAQLSVGLALEHPVVSLVTLLIHLLFVQKSLRDVFLQVKLVIKTLFASIPTDFRLLPHEGSL